MQRVLIVGCSGAGKTTLAWALQAKLGLAIVHLDREFWRPGWVESPRPEFLARLTNLLAGDAWIVDGNYDSTLDLRLRRADALIFLDFSRWRCLASVFARTLAHYGRTRPGLTPGCPERFSWEFIHWIWKYRATVRPRMLRYIEQFKADGHIALVLRSRAEVRAWLGQLPVSPR